MGGAGQVGAAFAVFVKTKKTTLRKAIAGGLIYRMICEGRTRKESGSPETPIAMVAT